MFLFYCLSCVVCSSRNNEVTLFYVSVLSAFLFCSKTRWFSCLHLVVLFLFGSFVLNLCSFFIPQKKAQKPGHVKNQKIAKMQKTKRCFQLAQLCSQLVFLIFGGAGSKMHFC